MEHLDLTEELKFRTSRSSGKGGQHVNKVDSRVELLFDVNQSQILTKEQKRLIRKKLSNRINSEGVLLLACQSDRSQLRNKKLVIKRFEKLLEKALEKEKKRLPTQPTRGMIEARLKAKKQRSEIKAMRGKVDLP